MIQRHEVAFVVAKPNQSTGRTRRRLCRSQKKIERSIVVEVGNVESYLAHEIPRSIRDSSNLGNVPAFSFVLVRNPNDSPVRLHRQEIKNSIVVRIGDGNRFDERQTCRERTLAELPLSLVHEDMQPTGAVDDGSVRVAVAVKIGPGKSAHA